MNEKIWECKIGGTGISKLPPGADFPMRRAVAKAYFEITGQEAEFLFSGWGASLTKVEKAVINHNDDDLLEAIENEN